MLHLSLKNLHKLYTLFFRSFIIFFLILFYGLAGLYYVLNWKPSLDEPTLVRVKKGEPLAETFSRLEQIHLIKSAFLAKFYMFFAKKCVIKAGDYKVPPHATALEIIKILCEGQGLSYKIFFPEGVTNKQILDILNQTGFLEEDDFDLPAEGLLFPDTYSIRSGSTYSQVIDFMHYRMVTILMDLWKKRPQNFYLKTPEEALVLASIIEKETSLDAERPKIASVFINRLKKGMRLQADPTTIYGLTGGDKLNRSLLRTDWSHKSDHNTYQINGLPPTPICNPGYASLKAALNPEKTNYLYFVATKKGGHFFSKNYQDHQKYAQSLRKKKSVRRKKK